MVAGGDGADSDDGGRGDDGAGGDNEDDDGGGRGDDDDAVDCYARLNGKRIKRMCGLIRPDSHT